MPNQSSYLAHLCAPCNKRNTNMTHDLSEIAENTGEKIRTSNWHRVAQQNDSWPAKRHPYRICVHVTK
jgi:hypothetical protein